MIMLFAVCGLLCGFGAHQILAFAQISRRVSILIAILVAMFIFGGALAGFAHHAGASLSASGGQVRIS
ncbi:MULTISPECIES: hypothetical protein [unclassified Bradyrhizobium]